MAPAPGIPDTAPFPTPSTARQAQTVITFMCPKGGVGKTMCAWCVAEYFAIYHGTVTMLDGDTTRRSDTLGFMADTAAGDGDPADYTSDNCPHCNEIRRRDDLESPGCSDHWGTAGEPAPWAPNMHPDRLSWDDATTPMMAYGIRTAYTFTTAPDTNPANPINPLPADEYRDDFIVIDTKPSWENQEVRDLAAVSDLVVIPGDLGTIMSIIEAIEDLSHETPNGAGSLPCPVVVVLTNFSRVDLQATTGRDRIVTLLRRCPGIEIIGMIPASKALKFCGTEGLTPATIRDTEQRGRVMCGTSQTQHDLQNPVQLQLYVDDDPTAKPRLVSIPIGTAHVARAILAITGGGII